MVNTQPLRAARFSQQVEPPALPLVGLRGTWDGPWAGT